MEADKPVVLAGGRVQLWCGDSLDLLRRGLLKFDAIVSDPPYGIGFQHSGGGQTDKLVSAYSKTEAILGDDSDFDPAPWIDAAGVRPVALMGADHFKTRLPEGGRFFCWDKSCGGGAASVFSDAEFGWTNRRNARSVFRHFWMGGLRAGRDGQSRAPRRHVAQKPVELMIWIIEHARIGVGKAVLDPYMGSGSTGMAALLCGRRFVGVELDRKHFAAARERIADCAQELGLA